MTLGDAVDILVVEDNKRHRESIVETLEASLAGVCVVAVPDSEAALDFLLARGAWVARAGEEAPKLILLNLNPPGSDTFSLLARIRTQGSDDALMLAPVVIFTDTLSAESARACYQHGANSYIVKPLRFTEFRRVVGMMGQYWITHNRTPN